MAQQRLYTEEQVIQAMILSDTVCASYDRILDRLTPIKLPTDEEIEQEAHMKYPVNLQPNGRTLAGGKYDIDINYSERNAFIECGKWMRDKIKGGNK